MSLEVKRLLLLFTCPYFKLFKSFRLSKFQAKEFGLRDCFHCLASEAGTVLGHRPWRQWKPGLVWASWNLSGPLAAIWAFNDRIRAQLMGSSSNWEMIEPNWHYLSSTSPEKSRRARKKAGFPTYCQSQPQQDNQELPLSPSRGSPKTKPLKKKRKEI